MNYNKLIDHTALKADTKKENIMKLCQEAMEFDFASVCVNPTWVSYCAEILKNSDVKVCTVIGFPLGANTKEIKMLELMIQHGEEGKIDYNPIDRLVGIYNDIIDKKLLTIAEYAKSTNESEAEVRKKITLANLMVEFLEYINAPKQFYIARDLELDGPLIELAAILKKCPDEETREKMKISMFSNILMKPEGDITRFVRQVKSVVETEYLDDFIEEQIEIAEQIAEEIPEKVTDSKAINEGVRKNEQLKNQLSHSMEKVVTKVKRTETRNRPALMVEKSIISLDSIDLKIIERLEQDELIVLQDKVEELKAKITILEKSIDENL